MVLFNILSINIRVSKTLHSIIPGFGLLYLDQIYPASCCSPDMSYVQMTVTCMKVETAHITGLYTVTFDYSEAHLVTNQF